MIDVILYNGKYWDVNLVDKHDLAVLKSLLCEVQATNNLFIRGANFNSYVSHTSDTNMVVIYDDAMHNELTTEFMQQEFKFGAEVCYNILKKFDETKLIKL